MLRQVIAREDKAHGRGDYPYYYDPLSRFLGFLKDNIRQPRYLGKHHGEDRVCNKGYVSGCPEAGNACRRFITPLRC